jgi:hypothetical protein
MPLSRRPVRVVTMPDPFAIACECLGQYPKAPDTSPPGGVAQVLNNDATRKPRERLGAPLARPHAVSARRRRSPRRPRVEPLGYPRSRVLSEIDRPARRRSDRPRPPRHHHASAGSSEAGPEEPWQVPVTLPDEGPSVASASAKPSVVDGSLPRSSIGLCAVRTGLSVRTACPSLRCTKRRSG